LESGGYAVVHLINRKQFTMSIPAGTWVIDPTHSDVSFVVRHLMISKVRGSFGAFSGELISGTEITDSKLTAKIDVSTITTNEEGRDGHLRSPEFFDTEKYPEISFVSTSVESGKRSDEFLIHGDLTIRDITKPITFAADFGGVAVDGYGQTKVAGELTTTINRTEFGLTWNSTLETGGVLVSEDVKISVDVQAVLQS
jgi:polyisoprenoid-binding protein YceI